MKKTSPFREEAVSLVGFDPNKGSYDVNPEAMAILKAIPAPIGVIGVAGMYRTGKSYLLNRMLLNRSDGFGVGPTVNPCTKGLWMWGSPIKGTTNDGQPINILVVDSEGIGALDEDSNHDTKIFSLTVLLSSIFIYNSVGSIDESAIQNLSLVVNLTKNIQLKNSGNEENDAEDFAMYFPTFVWIIRDFTLQLVDQFGEKITSKEYLERSLAPQQGFSDDVESKNRIRRLLTTFFPERECFTMVRPLLKEGDLQNLDKMELTKLRPEFYEQVMALRKKIMEKMKPKTLNGRNLSGDMYLGLMSSYVKAINEGTVPNIENAWTYLCREQAEKAVDETIVAYDKLVNDNLMKRIPTTLDDLRTQHRLVVQSALDIYKEKLISDEVNEEAIRELRKKMKEKFSKLKAYNDKESITACQNFIKTEWAPIEKKLKLNTYKSFNEFDREMNLFHSFLKEHGPSVEHRDLVFLDFMHKTIAEGALLFLKNLANESEIQKSISGEFKTKYEKENKELKDELTKEKTQNSSKLTALERQKTESELREDELKKALKELKEKQEKGEQELKGRYNDEQKKILSQFNELKLKLQSTEEELNNSKKASTVKDSEMEKRNALLTQRVEYLEKSLNETSAREKDLDGKYNALKNESSGQLKETAARYEGQLKNMQFTINEMSEKLLDYETRVSSESQNWGKEKENYKKKEDNFKKSIEEANKTIDTLMKQVNDMQTVERERATKSKKEYEEIIETLTRKLESFESNLKEKDDSLKTNRSTLERERAVLQQKLEFTEEELKAVKQQLIDAKKAHDATIKAFEMSQMDPKSQITQKEINELKEVHQKEKRQLENDINALKKQMGAQADQFQERINELELKLKLNESEYNKDLASLKEALETAEQTRTKLSNDLKNSDSNKLKAVKETEERYIELMKGLEESIEELKKTHAQEIKDLQAKSEAAMRQLREFYESEKVRLEKRLVEDKDKADKKYSQIIEEYETRIREETNNYEEEIENLKDELRDHEGQSQALMQQFENELDLRQKNIDNLEKLLKEAKDNLAKAQENAKAELDNLNNQFSNERNTLNEKIESLQREVNNKEKEIVGLRQRNENLEGALAKKDEAIEALKKELADGKGDANQKLEELNRKYQELADEYLEKKINYEKNAALAEQQIDFLKKKLEEIQKLLEETIQKYEDKIRKLKEDMTQDMNVRIGQIMEERSNMEQRHEKLKKSAKDNDQNKDKKLAELEKERAILQEKLENLQARCDELESKLTTETHQYNLQISNIRDNQESERKPLLADLEKYRALCMQLELDKGEILALYDRDRELWSGKFRFLETQKEQARADLQDAMHKFEQTLQNLQKARANDPNQKENITDMLLTIEKKYQSQMAEAAENQSKMMQELEDKNKRLEKELKNLRDKLVLDTHGKLGNQNMNEKKLNDYMESEKRLQNEMEQIKIERDVKIVEYQTVLDKEREMLRNKCNDMENRFKESENKRTNQLYEHEKERAKWFIEKDHLLNQKNDIQDTLMKLEKKKEILLRENEKLRNDYKNSKRNNNYLQSSIQKSLNLSQHLNDALKKSPSNSKLGDGNYQVTTKITTNYSNFNDDDVTKKNDENIPKTEERKSIKK